MEKSQITDFIESFPDPAALSAELETVQLMLEQHKRLVTFHRGAAEFHTLQATMLRDHKAMLEALLDGGAE